MFRNIRNIMALFLVAGFVTVPAVSAQPSVTCGPQQADGKIAHAIKYVNGEYQLHITSKVVTRYCTRSDGTSFEKAWLVASTRWTDPYSGKVDSVNCGGSILDNYDKVLYGISMDYATKDVNLTLACEEDGTARKRIRLPNTPTETWKATVDLKVVVGFAKDPKKTISFSVN